MDTDDARALIALNNRFYRDHAASFSATRATPWQGWARVAELAASASADKVDEPLRALDLACGNMRLARHLARSLPRTRIDYYGVDRCAELVEAGHPSARPSDDDGLAPAQVRVHFREADILEALLAPATAGNNLESLAGIPACDLSCCFGFMHHVPSKDLRVGVIRALIEATAPGGIVVLSFWRFMDDDRLAAKARTVTEQARATGTAPALDANDYLLGWQDDAAALRYCHHFTEDEISELARSVAGCAQEIEQFSADGKSGALNRYLVLTRRG